MTNGPVEYLVIAFPDGTISDEVAADLGDLVNKKLISILDVVFITMDDDGATVAEFDEVDQLASFLEIDGEAGGLIGPDDISYVSAELQPGWAAAVLLIEDLWAAPLAGTLDRTGGVLVEGSRIPKDLVDDALAELPAAS